MSTDRDAMTRRRFLSDAGRATLPVAAASVLAKAADGPVEDEPDPQAVVVRAWANKSVDGLVRHRRLLGELLDDALRLITKQKTAGDAWHALLKPDDIVGIKFNRSGAYGFKTTSAVARMLIGSLTEAGWPPERIVLIEVPSRFARNLKTRLPAVGWSKTVTDFGSGTDQLAAVLDQVTALINVPFLKTHNIAGMTSCLKNLSHGLIRHPARYHANGCLPFIADIAAVPAIREKLKLNVVNALRAVWDGGPEVRPAYVFEGRAMLVSTDPVAADIVGTEILDRERAERKKPPIGGQEGLLPLWRAAGRRALGVSDRDRIIRRQVHL